MKRILLGFVVAVLGCITPSPGERAAATIEAADAVRAESPESDDFQRELKERLEILLAPRVDAGAAPGKCVGMAAGVTWPHGRVFVGLGSLAKGQPERPTENTIFQIGSVSKVFTGLLLARAAARGDVALDDPVGPYLPVPPPSYGGRQITLEHLATHYSGVPTFPSNTVSQDPVDPLKGYTIELLNEFLKQGWSPAIPPGTGYSYSNLGINILGLALVRRAMVGSYMTLVRRDIAGPLKMNDTAVVPLSEEQKRRLALGHRMGSALPPMETGPGGGSLDGGGGGAGSLLSTANDMLRLIEEEQRPSPELAPAVAIQLEPRRPAGPRPPRIGLAIGIDDSSTTTQYMKDGATAGFSAFILFTRQPRPVGVVLLCNAGQVELPDLAGAVLTEAVAINSRPSPVASVSAANYSGTSLAPEAIVAAFGSGLATATTAATVSPLPAILAGTTVKVRDSAGTERLAPLFFVAPTQVNYLMPAGTANGAATVTITSGDGTVSAGTVQIASVAPGLFAADASGRGLAAATALRVKADGSQQFEPVARFDAAQNKFVAVPIDLGLETDQVFLLLFGTGIRFRSALSAVTAKLGGVDCQAPFAGAQGDFAGLDQVNVRLLRGLIGKGEVDLALTVDGQTANTLKVHIK